MDRMPVNAVTRADRIRSVHTSGWETGSALSRLRLQSDFDLIFSYLKIRNISGLLLFINKSGIKDKEK